MTPISTNSAYTVEQDKMDIGHHQETIKCPSCGKIQAAVVAHTEPHWTYIHECDCGCIILESEWEVADLTEELEKLL